MARRRRRVSNSTVATFDSTQTQWASESSILKSLTPADEDPDGWPCFVLADAVILHKDRKRLANPLFVDTEGPFVVRGVVEFDEGLRHLFKGVTKSAPIEIEASWLYSIGYDPVTLWVSGMAGWFEIVPSPRYEVMYKEVREAIELYYAILLAYEAHADAVEEYAALPKARRKKSAPPRPLTLDRLFLKYAVAVGDGVYRHEVEERFHKWSKFLINHFPKEREFDWSGTLFHEWMIQEHPDIYKNRLDNRLNQKSKATPVSRQIATSARAISTAREVALHDPEAQDSRSRASASDPGKVDRMRRLSKSQSRVPSESPALEEASNAPAPGVVSSSTPLDRAPHESSDAADKGFKMLLEFMDDLANEAGTTSKLRYKSLVTKVYLNCKMRDYQNSRDILGYYSKRLLENLPARWDGTRFHEDLKLVAKEPFAPVGAFSIDELPLRLRRRDRVNRSSAPKPTHPALGPLPSRRRGGSESSLEVRDGILGHGSKTVGHRAGKVGGLRLASASKKRPGQEMDESSGSGRGRKSAKWSHPMTRDLAEDASSDASGVATASEEDVEEDMDDVDGFLSAHPPKDAVRLVVRAEKIPSMSPTGPNGTWVCDQPDCGFVVRQAQEDEGKAAIEEHFREHETQSEMVDLAVSEGSRGHLPIDHLLERIQSVGRKAVLSERRTINGKVVPAPLKRRLLV
ncbi:hypothetical protein VTK73DRAFT_4597 [Phialemonium thermophilum]|uniref:DNA (cytosine-5)-methyltransferase 1 replication foci domain-containing protein n=1 Tax=Phialemonium thermophilum TaxID=223376 RepID=A0ABR3XZQ5_9PEZI